MRNSILVVEDDVLIRLIVRHYLEGMGWKVLEVQSGASALKFLNGSPGPIDAVLTDLRLPDMNGAELARRAQVDCPIIFMSGTPSSAKEDLPGPVLYKPFNEEGLRSMFATVMPLD